MTQALQTHGKGINKKRNWRFKVNSDAKRETVKETSLLHSKVLSFYQFIGYKSVLNSKQMFFQRSRVVTRCSTSDARIQSDILKNFPN